jgi:hypothetical protein
MRGRLHWKMPFMQARRFARGETYVLDTAALYQPQKEGKLFVLVLANCGAPSQLSYSMDRAHTTDIWAPSPVPCSVTYHHSPLSCLKVDSTAAALLLQSFRVLDVPCCGCPCPRDSQRVDMARP